MGVFYHLSLTFLFILFLIPPLFADNCNSNSTTTNNNNNSTNIVVDNITASNPSPSPSLQQIRPNSSPFKPSIAVIVGVLTTLFSITFLLLLYAKHCGRNNNNPFGYAHASSLVSSSVSARRNSGINRAVVESLPLFRFSSLGGQKDGLECAVCLTRFEPNELLRLLPKCKHAFHVECVDTWLDAHSSCPLCRYRVDPEDILLIEEDCSSRQNQDLPAAAASSCFESTITESESSRTRRVSGRHSYAGERAITSSSKATTWFRRSLDSSSGGSTVVGVGGYRKDGLLLLREDEKKRLEHRIIVSGLGGAGGAGGSGLGSGFHQRWSDVQPSDLLYLRSEMIISQNRRLGIGASVAEAEAKNNNIESNGNGKGGNGSESESIGIDGIGRSVINSRSVSEITGLSRFSSKVCDKKDNDNNNNSRHNRRRREGQAAAAAGLVSRWLAWISTTSHSDVRSQPVDTIARMP
ncbi:hypothetical protein REPUB_Repub03eG0145600 [Reevesia pubescens]